MRFKKWVGRENKDWCTFIIASFTSQRGVDDDSDDEMSHVSQYQDDRIGGWHNRNETGHILQFKCHLLSEFNLDGVGNHLKNSI